MQSIKFDLRKLNQDQIRALSATLEVKADCWTLEDSVIIKGCAQRLIIEFCQAEINNAQH